MSARAASRLVSWQFAQVFRYTAGKADWAAAGLPIEGTRVTSNRTGSLALRDVPTCMLTDRADTVRQQILKHSAKLCAVLDEHRVLLGQISAEQVVSQADRIAEEIMASGPTTFRPNAEFRQVCDFFKAHKTEAVWVTTNDGELLGLLRLETLQREGLKIEQPACLH